MELDVISIVWTVVAILAGMHLSASLNFLRKKENSSRNNVGGNGDHTTPVAAAATPSVVLPLSQNYEVFLNFRGKDTRKTFADNLYHGLVGARVCVFRDSEELHIGEEIHPNLLAATQNSKISIPIISPNYASSKWCLLELVQILKCKETLGQIIIPIFYHVDPSDVRHQTGGFGRGFSLLKKKHSGKTVEEWKEALKKVAYLKAFELKDNADGYEGKLIKQVVEKVLIDLNKTTLVVPEYLVGVEEQAREIMKMVDEKSSNDVQVVLIHGMGGIGKTTLAKYLYNQLTSHFQFCSFLEIVRETPMQQLEKKLISSILKKEWPQDIYHPDEGTCIIKNTFRGTKVLLVLDDVKQRDQLDGLMGRHDCFGLGSIIIVTSRNLDVLKPCHVKLIYEVREFNFDQSFQLFCKHALQREDSRCGELGAIARDIVSTTGGLPLAIVVIGSFLLGKDMDIWKETLKKLKEIPHAQVHLKLKISYDALDYEQQQIFLDIANLFSSWGKLEYFLYMWDDCKYYPKSGIEVLKSLSLIKSERRNGIIMHDQLRLLGREIVREQSRDLPGKRSILWDQEEALEVIEINQGTEKIEVLNLAGVKKSEEKCLTNQQFRKLTKLRLLRMSDANLVGNFKNYFLNLRWLQWYRCPPNFKATGFRPKNLVILNLSKSNITERWGGWSEMKHAEKLKVLELQDCSQLKATPDFSTFKELERLDLLRCKRLKRIHPSICRLTKTLKYLNLNGCEELEQLPIELGTMEELRNLNLQGTSLREIPLAEGFMTKLEGLYAYGCKKLARLPDSIGSLTKLERLIMQKCVSLTVIPKSIGKLESLSFLNLSETNVEEVPDSIGNLRNLRDLLLYKTPIKRLPATIGMLKELKTISLYEAHRFPEVPEEIGELSRLQAVGLRGTSIALPDLPSSVRWLDFSGCRAASLPNVSHLTNLYCLTLKDMGMGVIPELPSSLRKLYLRSCQKLRALPNFADPKHLLTLDIEDCNELMEIEINAQCLERLTIRTSKKMSKLSVVGSSLTILSLESCDGLKSLSNLSTFKGLQKLKVVKCNNIVEIQGLDSVKWLKWLRIHDCSSLERIDGFSRLTTLHRLRFGNCPKLRDINYACIEKYTSLEELCLYGGSPTLKFPDLSKLRNVKMFGMIHFEELREIPKLQELKSLLFLDISRCKSLENLPDFSEFTNLRGLNAQSCEKLTELQGLENLNSFESLSIFGCRSLKGLPKLREGIIRYDKKELSWWQLRRQWLS